MINYCVSMGVDLERGPLTNLDNKLAQEMTEQEGEAMDSNKMSRSIAEKTAKLHRSGVNIWPKRDKKNLRFVQLKTHNFRSIISISLQNIHHCLRLLGEADKEKGFHLGEKCGSLKILHTISFLERNSESEFNKNFLSRSRVSRK